MFEVAIIWIGTSGVQNENFNYCAYLVFGPERTPQIAWEECFFFLSREEKDRESWLWLSLRQARNESFPARNTFGRTCHRPGAAENFKCSSIMAKEKRPLSSIQQSENDSPLQKRITIPNPRDDAAGLLLLLSKRSVQPVDTNCGPLTHPYCSSTSRLVLQEGKESNKSSTKGKRRDVADHASTVCAVSHISEDEGENEGAAPLRVNRHSDPPARKPRSVNSKKTAARAAAITSPRMKARHSKHAAFIDLRPPIALALAPPPRLPNVKPGLVICRQPQSPAL